MSVTKSCLFIVSASRHSGHSATAAETNSAGKWCVSRTQRYAIYSTRLQPTCAL